MTFTRKVLYPCNPGTVRGASTKLNSNGDKVIYANGRIVVVHDLKDLGSSRCFSGHAQNTTVAQFSHTGYYCASADVTGLVKIWDTIGEDQSVKYEYKVISGRINDLAWDGESKRIIAVGDGRERFAHPFMVDTGTSCGEVTGHSKVINTVSIRRQRPYRAVTGGDDGLIIFYQGTPYKYDKTIKTHTRFVQDVKYAPSGDLFASVGSDYKAFLYDGKTGDTLTELIDDPHKGSIMACSWSADGKSFMTSSLDCTVKLWDVESKKVAKTWTLGKGVPYQQVGCVWTTSDDLVSLSMSGDLNIFDKREGGPHPSRVLQSPQKAITAAVRGPSASDTFIAGTADGRVFSYHTASQSVSCVEGEGHTNLVSGLSAGSDGTLYSSGFDDRVREISANDGAFSFTQATFGACSQPKTLAIAGDDTLFVVEINVIEAIRSNQRVFELKPKYSPSAIAATKDIVAVGSEDNMVYVYTWDGKALTESYVLVGNKRPITAIALSSNGDYIAAGDSAGKIVLFSTTEKKKITDRWTNHTARIASLAFLSPSPTEPAMHLASTSLDTSVCIYSVTNITLTPKYVAIRGAAPGGGCAIVWLECQEQGKGRLVSGGSDGCARIWEIVLP